MVEEEREEELRSFEVFGGSPDLISNSNSLSTTTTTTTMSYALETKKRKFHRVLDSLSKPPQSPDPSPKSTARTATAREHPPTNLSIKKVRLSNGDDSELSSVRNSVLKVTKPGSRVSSAQSTTRPSFVPWDRERFLERLETFRRVDRWSPKPAAVNEVAWSKRGWICTDVSRVTCVGGCGGSMVVKLPDELDELDGYDAEKVQERKEVRMCCDGLGSWLDANRFRCQTCRRICEAPDGRSC